MEGLINLLDELEKQANDSDALVKKLYPKNNREQNLHGAKNEGIRITVRRIRNYVALLQTLDEEKAASIQR